MMMFTRAALSIAVLVPLAAADDLGLRYGIGTGGANWTDAVENPVPGIDAASVSRITLYSGPPTGVTFVVWSDLPNQRSGSGGGGVRDGASYEGYHRSSDGRQIDFRATSTTETPPTVTIEDVVYDLRKGSLFLVSAGPKKMVVKQVNFDITTLPKRPQQLRKFAKSNGPIKDFFQSRQRGGPASRADRRVR